jgi:Tfp pilus assembly protein PilV
MKKKFNEGQSLLEIVLVIGIASVVLVGLTKATTVSLRNAQFAKNKTLATKYAQETMEKIRAYRDQNDWNTFKGCSPSLSSLPEPFEGVPVVICHCYAGHDSRPCDAADVDKVEVEVTILWETHEVELVSFFTKWPIPIMATAPTVTPTPPAPSGKYVFLTSTTSQGDLGGLSGADAKCQSLADAAGLPGTYKAWLSGRTIAAKDRLTHASLPYSLVDGTKIADNWDDLVDGTIDNKLNKDESGNLVLGGRAATNTRSDGSVKNSTSLETCDEWTTSSYYYNCRGGVPAATDGGWTDAFSTNCTNDSFRLYCFQQ